MHDLSQVIHSAKMRGFVEIGMGDMASQISSWSAALQASDALDVRLLGCVDFDSAVLLQQRMVYEVSGRNDRFGGLLLCEHPPLITVGRDGSRRHIRTTDEDLDLRHLSVRWVTRGGGVIVHGPGQLAVYPVIPLQRVGLGLFAYREALEGSVSAMCRELKLSCKTAPAEPGVWGRCGKFTHIGVAVKHWISYFGLYIDVSTDPELLKIVRNPGRHNRLTSLATERVQRTSMHSVRESLVRHLTAHLGYRNFNLTTGHPLLKRRRLIHDHSEHTR